MTLMVKDKFNFGICTRYDNDYEFKKAGFYDVYALFVYEPKDGKLD